MPPTKDEVRALLGKRVVATINVQDSIVAIGTLVGFGEGGDFEIVEDDGFVHYCWPLLNIREIGEDVHGGNWNECKA